jgi:hypothetical protein
MTYPAALFSVSDVENFTALINKLYNDPDPKTRPLSKIIWSQLGTNSDYLTPSDLPISSVSSEERTPEKQKQRLADGLNAILQSDAMFNAVNASGMRLPDAQRQLATSNVGGDDLVVANRTFLEDMYSSDYLGRSHYLAAPQFRITDRGSSVLLSFGGFALFLLGRITGSLALRKVRPYLMLALYAGLNVLMMILAMNHWGWFSVAGLFLSFFFMSIMYPTIFSLGIHGLGEKTKIGSSFIVMSIVGGAFMPLLMGKMADLWGMPIGFGMPLGCFIFIAFYGLMWRKLEANDAAVG